jgi:predicted RNA polymerase sigma factor
LQRAKRELVNGGVTLDLPVAEELEPRLAVVQRVLYLLFNEGYLSTAGERAVREDLCEEAVRLGSLLAMHPRYGTPATMALLALMLFHAARLEARLDEAGRILLLEEQDRGKWDTELIEAARRCLDASARGERISTYHLEAGIVMQHCRAESFAATDWSRILELYDALLSVQRSPIYLLNRAITLAHLSGPRAGIEALAELKHDSQLADYHLLDSTLGELHRRLGDFEVARGHFERARAKTRSEPDRELLTRKLALCEPSKPALQ